MSDSKQEEEPPANTTLKAIIYYNKDQLKYKFPSKSKIAHIEEFLKRKMKIKPIEAIYLFDKHRKKLLNSGESLEDVAERQALSGKLTKGINCEIIMRLSETYGRGKWEVETD